MCRRLLDETGVALLPGTAFGRPADEWTARMAFVDFDGKTVLQAVEKSLRGMRFPSRLKKHFERSVEGVDEMCSWTGDGQQ